MFFHTTFQELNLLPSSGEGFVVRTTVFFYYDSSLALTGIRTSELFRSSVLWITSPERYPLGTLVVWWLAFRTSNPKN